MVMFNPLLVKSSIPFEDEESLSSTIPGYSVDTGPSPAQNIDNQQQALPPQNIRPVGYTPKSLYGGGISDLLSSNDFSALSKLFPQESDEERSQRNLRNQQMLYSSWMHDVASAARGADSDSLSNAQAYVAKDEAEHAPTNQRINRLQQMMNLYKGVTDVQNLGDERRQKILNTYLDTTPNSPKAQQRAQVFKQQMDAAKETLLSNAKQMGLNPEEVKGVIGMVDQYKNNVGNMSYAEMEKLLPEIQRQIDNNIKIGFNAATASQKGNELDYKKDKEKFDQNIAQSNLDLHKWMASIQANHMRNQDELDKLKLELMGKEHKEKAETKASTDEEKIWEKIGKLINPNSGHTRDVIGKAKDTINRYNRLEKIMNNPNGMTEQDYNIAAADLASMVQGGNPTVAGTQESKYETLKGNMAGILQKITANPKFINTPGIKEHILENSREMAKVSREAISSNSRLAKTTHKKTIEKSDENKRRFAKMAAEALDEGDKVDRAIQALEDENAPQSAKEAAKKVLDYYGGR